MKMETVAVHAGRLTADPKPIVPSLCLSTNFEQSSDFVYTRRDNPVRATLEHCLAELEGGVGCATFASGSAAIYATFLCLPAGSHVILPSDAFFITRRIVEETFARLGHLSCSWVDTSSPDQIRAAIGPSTRMLFIENPSNPLLRLTDIRQASALCREHGVLLVCDNTVATAFYQRPLDLGADIVVVSTTKYLAGHGDALGGAVIWKDAKGLGTAIKQVQGDWGGVPSPFDCWLTLRGIKTFPLRMASQSKNAALIATFLLRHPRVSRVYYPGLCDTTETIEPFSGLVAFELDGGITFVKSFLGALKLFSLATSFGGPESTAELRAATEGLGSTLPPGLVRLSIGLEDVQDLIDDLEHALQQETNHAS